MKESLRRSENIVFRGQRLEGDSEVFESARKKSGEKTRLGGVFVAVGFFFFFLRSLKKDYVESSVFSTMRSHTRQGFCLPLTFPG